MGEQHRLQIAVAAFADQAEAIRALECQGVVACCGWGFVGYHTGKYGFSGFALSILERMLHTSAPAPFHPAAIIVKLGSVWSRSPRNSKKPGSVPKIGP